jgi:hypothetical protein
MSTVANTTFDWADRTGFVVMRDPEGNEFCVERSQAEREPGA